MIAALEKAFTDRQVTVTDTVKVAAFNIKPGVTSEDGERDEWLALKIRILATDILSDPIWMGQVGSLAKRMLQRMDAFPEETNEKGSMPSYGKVAGNQQLAIWRGLAVGGDFGRYVRRAVPS